MSTNGRAFPPDAEGAGISVGEAREISLPAPPTGSRAPGGWTDTLAAIAIGIAVLAVYAATAYPGLAGLPQTTMASVDAAEFQFVGRILGTAQNPGYPLFVLISHAFSYLPVGSLAYRVNVMSGLFGAMTAALLFLLLRQLRSASVPALAGALGLAFGRVFWSQSIVAEVYTLNAALMMGAMLFALRWTESRTRSNRDLYLAVALVALGLGNHLSMLVCAAAIGAYVLWTDRSLLRQPRTLAICAGLLALGLAQYAFIIVRTHQQAPYLATAARGAGELIRAIVAPELPGRGFSVDLATIVSERLTQAARWFFLEFGALGLALAIAGLIQLSRERKPEGLLFGIAATAMLIVALTYRAPAIQPLLLPAFVLVWPLAGVGLAWCRDWLSHHYPAALVTAFAFFLPASQIVANYSVNDQHDYTFTIRYFDGLIDQLPRKSAIVTDRPFIDHMVRYKLLGERAGGAREIVLIDRDPAVIKRYRDQGYAVYAFAAGREELEQRGMRFQPEQIMDVALPEYLRLLEKGSLVALAAGAGFSSALAPDAVSALRTVGGTGKLFGRPRFAYGLIGARGASSGALEALQPDEVGLEVKPGDVIGATGVVSPVAVRVGSAGTGGAVWVNDAEVARAERGAALAVITPDGRVADAVVVDPDRRLRIPFDMKQLPFFQLSEFVTCAALGHGGWMDVTEVASAGGIGAWIGNGTTGSNDRRRDRSSAEGSTGDLILYLGRDRPLNPRLTTARPLDVQQFVTSDPQGASRLAENAERDGLTAADRITKTTYVYRVRLGVETTEEPVLSSLGFGGVPQVALARARIGSSPKERATICPLPIGGEGFFRVGRGPVHIRLGLDQRAFFGHGWHQPEHEGSLQFRWTADREAELLVPLARTGRIQVRVGAKPALYPGAPYATMTLQVNGTPLESQLLRPGWSVYGWTPPATAWKTGTNQILIGISRVQSPAEVGQGEDARIIGVAVSELTFELQEAGS